jgi:hypothetical protein
LRAAEAKHVVAAARGPSILEQAGDWLTTRAAPTSVLGSALAEVRKTAGVAVVGALAIGVGLVALHALLPVLVSGGRG